MLEHAACTEVNGGGHLGENRRGHALRRIAADVQADGVVQALQRRQVRAVWADLVQQALGAIAWPQLADIGRRALQHAAQPVAILAVAVAHDRHHGAVGECVQVIGWAGIDLQYRICVGKALGAGEMGAAIDHGDVPVQQFGHMRQRLRIMPGAEDHQAPLRRQVFAEHLYLATRITVAAQ